MNYRAVCFELLAERSALKGKNKALLATLESIVEWLQTGKVDGVGCDEQSIFIDDIIEVINKAKGGE
tara:strand:- start:4624 stop:4824 length:201 start_codon:yes stop_codon:yes gene_type:complete